MSLVPLIAGCGDEGRDEQAPIRPAASANGPVREVRDVVDAKLREIGDVDRDEGAGSLELREDTGLLPQQVEGESEAPVFDHDAGLDPDQIEFRDGLVALAARRPRDLPIVRHDFESAGPEFARVIAAGLRDVQRDPAELHVLVQVADVVPCEAAARALVELAGTAEPAWLRAAAARAIVAQWTAPEADAVVPALLYRTKYERDTDALAWVYVALARFGNGTGFRKERSDDGMVMNVTGKLAALGIESPLAKHKPSAALRNEIWRWIADLSGEHFQLRGVDDARYVLSHLEPWAAEELALALEDDDPYVRLHTAQVLERMGERGAPAKASLVASLHDPNVGVQGAAAEALGRVAGESAGSALIERLDEEPAYEARVALVRALSRLPADARPVDRLRAEFESAPASDLRLAAAEGLLAAGGLTGVLPWLADELEARVGDPAGAEAVLEDAIEGSGQLAELREGWRALGARGQVIHTAEEARERRAARARLVREFAASRGD